MKINSNEFFNYLSNTINESGKTDSQIADECNIGRVAVWKIRNSKTKSIRRDTLNKISKSLGMSYKFKGQDISFDLDTTKPIGGSEMANNTADKVIDHLMTQVQQANDVIASLKQEVNQKDIKIDEQNKMLIQAKIVLPQLDQKLMQILVQVSKDKKKFLDLTTKYASFLGYKPIDLHGENYSMVVHKDEDERLAYYEKNPQVMKDKVPWKMVHKNGQPLYIMSSTKVLSNPDQTDDTIMLVELESISEQDYNIEVSEGYFDSNNKGLS